MRSIEPLIRKTYESAYILRNLPDSHLKKTLKMLSQALITKSAILLKANQKDIELQDKENPRIDRLLLNEQRIKNIAASLLKISNLPNPSGKVLEKRRLYNGLELQKISVPLGVVGAIYESRPNVTFDIASLCLRSGNSCLLKGSREAEHTNKEAVQIIHEVLRKNGIPEPCVTLLPSDREVLQELFTATHYIDVLIPRGSDQLIQFVRKNSLVPVIETGAGVCHVYIEQEADLRKAIDIAVNAKVSRPSVCNAADTILVDRTIAPEFFQRLQPQFEQHGVELFADKKAYALLKGYPYLQKATEEDFGREYLSLKCSVKITEDIEDALHHIRKYSTRHSEAIVSENRKQCQRFVQEVDAAVVYTNASTRFTDGEEFGLGAEIGISTQKLHARGPFALEKLVTEKWIVKGKGQIRTP